VNLIGGLVLLASLNSGFATDDIGLYGGWVVNAVLLVVDEVLGEMSDGVFFLFFWLA